MQLRGDFLLSASRPCTSMSATVSDASIWYFDTDEDVLAPYDGSIELAYEGVDNVFYTLNADGDIDFMVVDHDRYDSIVINNVNKF